ncbi:uncharacterized protein IUM83_07179 [Phytophthora cinnamomi]|uniref:uncharacterized protein n=1 Tax=Phytophthora cinnamomi TaxID=4785 RepID=UPI00355A1BB9|nr:hypothetical protein IUM83_07179 [Phytophthora cinnamomi]
MQVGRPLDGDVRRFRGGPRVAVASVGAAFHRPAPKSFAAMVPVEEIRLDVVGSKTLGQGRRRSDIQRQSSLEDIRPASPMASKPKGLLNPVKSDGRVHPSWTEVESEPETAELSVASGDHLHSFRVEDTGSFRNMEVLTCFRSEVRRGLCLLLKAATAEKWHMCWAALLSMFLLPMILMLMVVAGVGFVVLSTWVTIAAVVVCPLAYVNPRLYNYATDS